MNREVKVTVQMKTKNMYEFLLLHAYKGIKGILSVLFSVVAFIYLVTNYTQLTKSKVVVFVFASLLFTVINPIVLWFNSTKQVKLNPMFQKPIDYILNEEGVTVSQAGSEASVSWDEVLHVKETKQSVILYLSKARAYILPNGDIGENRTSLQELVNAQIEANKCKWK